MHMSYNMYNIQYLYTNIYTIFVYTICIITICICKCLYNICLSVSDLFPLV